MKVLIDKSPNAVFLLAFMGCAANSHVEHVVRACANIGDAAEVVESACVGATRTVTATEGEELVAYYVTNELQSYFVEMESDRTQSIRFVRSDAPLFGVRIGDEFSAVRGKYPEARLLYGAEEERLLALYVETAGLVFLFDSQGIPDDWFFLQSPPEAVVGRNQLVGIRVTKN
jgi:hypothetical protein